MNLYGIKKIIVILKLGLNHKIRKLSWKQKLSLLSVLKYAKMVKIAKQVMLQPNVPPFPSEAFDRQIEAAVQLTQGKVIPITVHISLTNECPYRCWHCSNAYNSGSEMSLDVIKDLIKQLQERGLSVIAFTGGEPLMRNDLTEIISSVGPKSMCMMFTTGYGLSLTRARELKAAGLFSILISLDHYRSEIHDTMRNYRGAYKIALESIAISKKVGFYTVVQAVAHRELFRNDEIWKFLEYTARLGVHEVVFLEETPTGRLITSKERFLDAEKREKLRKVHIKANKIGKYPKVTVQSYLESNVLLGCQAGFNFFYIDASGNVCPCDFVPLSFGNIQKESIDTIWQRFRKVFKMPSSKCFILENIDRIKALFNGQLPLDYEKTLDICNGYQCDKPSEMMNGLLPHTLG